MLNTGQPLAGTIKMFQSVIVFQSTFSRCGELSDRLGVGGKYLPPFPSQEYRPAVFFLAVIFLGVHEAACP